MTINLSRTRSVGMTKMTINDKEKGLLMGKPFSFLNI